MGGKRVLEYGCGTGSHAYYLATSGAEVIGIDISPVRLAQARQDAMNQGLSIEFVEGDAEHLPFADASFDRVVGGAILHHLDLDAAYREVARVLRPEGDAYFIEPLGHNPAINWYRRRTPQMRTEDEHPLLMGDLARAHRFFSRVDVDFYHLFALGAAPLFGTPLFRPTTFIGDILDRLAMRLSPLQPLAWTALIRLKK